MKGVVDMSKNNVGRPTKMTPDRVEKLELGFMKGLNDVQCCLFAGIDRTTLWKYCEKHPEFRNKIEELKNNPAMRAKILVADAIEKGDKDMAKWYLERKEKSEFSLKQEIAASITYEDKLKELADEDEY